MLLSPYQNPPYRMPSSELSTRPPVESSPKRKRDGPAPGQPTTAPALHLDVQNVQHDDSAPCPDSPRTNVADKLKNLDIRPAQPISLESVKLPTSPRKKLKREPPSPPLARLDDLAAIDAPLSSKSPSLNPPSDSSGDIVEISETPGRRQQPSEPPTVLQHDGISPPDSGHRRRLSSPPPPTPRIKPATTLASEDSTPTTLTLSDFDYSAPKAPSLTWRDEEITGHELDLTSPDDDGEGINGVGFRPTPAIAYARSQKRKQQVNDWKAREAREARQKRIERRRGAGFKVRESEGVIAEQEQISRRMVRFKGVG